MAQQKMDSFLKKTKKQNASTTAFLRQLNAIEDEFVPPDSTKQENEISELRDSLIKLTLEKEESEDSVKVLKNQVETLSQKYSKLKVAHLSLLQLLFEKEQQIKAQDLKINRLMVSQSVSAHEIHSKPPENEQIVSLE